MNRRLAAAALLGALGVWAGCTAFDGAVLPDKGEVTTSSTSTSTSTSTSSSSGSGCPRFPVPSNAPSAAEGTGGDIEVIVAVQEISLGVEKGAVAKDFGYDLDGVCTCAPDPGSCIPRKEAGDAGPPCDGDLGRDVATGALVAALSIAGPYDPSKYANEAFAKGMRGILLRLQSYNGELNDDEIRFSVYRTRSTGTPNFADVDDPWEVEEDDLKKDGIATYEAISVSGGFVKDGLLVVNNLVTSRIPFNDDSDLVLKQVRFTGRLKLDAATSRWHIEDVVSVGRWPLPDALQTVSRVKDPNNSDKRLCNNGILMGLARDRVCAAADITESPEDDRNNRSCSAISTAVKLKTVPAAFGGTYKGSPDNACSGIVIEGCK